MNQTQLQSLKQKFCLDVVDHMDMDTLVEFVYDQLLDSYSDFDLEEMKDEIVTYYMDSEEEYNQLVEDVNSVGAKATENTP